MAAQQKFTDNIIPFKVAKKRVRFKVPTYKKYYKFDERDEPHVGKIKLLHKLHKLIADEVLKFQLNFIFDDLCIEIGKLKLHIDGEYNRLLFMDKKPTKIWDKYQTTGWGHQAEIADSYKLPVKSRVKIHLKLLKYLRQGLTVRQAIRRAVKGIKWASR